jgi:hypothetical protein
MLLHFGSKTDLSRFKERVFTEEAETMIKVGNEYGKEYIISSIILIVAVVSIVFYFWRKSNDKERVNFILCRFCRNPFFQILFPTEQNEYFLCRMEFKKKNIFLIIFKFF